MHQVSAAQLLDRLYALNDQAGQWPELVQNLLDVLNLSAAQSETAQLETPLAVLNEQRLLEWLTPHVQRVLEFQQREHGNRELRDFFEDLLGRHPVAIALCDSLGNVRWASQPLRDMLASATPLRIQDMVRSGLPRPSLHTLQTAEGVRTLVQIDVPALGPHFCALLLQGDSPAQLDPAQLDRQYGLTRAEAAIANLMAQGLSPEDIARTNGTALVTVRSQIKKILAKLGVSRQAEAVAFLLAGTAHIHLGAAPQETSPARTHANFVYKALRIAYVVHGPADGRPVFFLHSWVGSRQQVPWDTRPLFEQGIKLIALDRPGMGASTGPVDAPAEWMAQALQALAQQLGHARFALMGYSLGALYALHYAQALGDVVEQVFLVSPVAPLRGLRDLRGALPSGQLLMGLAMKAPLLAEKLVRLWMAHMRRSPALYLESVLPHLATQDQRIMSSKDMRSHYVDSFLEAIRQGDDGLMQELRHMASNWSHHIRVQQPTRIWHGEQDSHVPLMHARRLCDEMQRCTLTTLPEAGHFLLFHQWPTIVAEVAAALSPITNAVNPQ